MSNPIIAYYNINSLRNKIIDIRYIMLRCLPDVFVMAETKLNYQFPNSQFLVENYYEPTRVDDTSESGGLIEYTRKGIINKRKTEFELKSFSSICSELTINKIKWLVLSFYRKPYGKNIDLFFSELTMSMNIAICKYDNIVIIGDINIDSDSELTSDFEKLSSFCDIFSFKNLIKDKTCFTHNHQSSIDIILTNKPRSFQKTSCFELGVSDCHKLVMTTLKSHVIRLRPKHILYRCYKKFSEESFLKELNDEISQNDRFFSNTSVNPNSSYDMLRDLMQSVLNKHAPQKRKCIRGNNGNFMNKELSKAIMNRSRLKSNYNKNPTPSNRLLFTKQRNFCVTLRRKAIRSDFSRATKNGIMSRNEFYKLVTPYISNKGGLLKNDIILVENGNIISDDLEVANAFNLYYTNIVETTTGNAPVNIADTMAENSLPSDIINKIIETYKNHPSVTEINKAFVVDSKFKFKEVLPNYINGLLHDVNPKKSTGDDYLPPKIVKISADSITIPMTNIVNASIKSQIFPSSAKSAAICPIYKSIDRSIKSNYRPLSVLPSFSKIFENVIKDQITPYFDNYLSVYLTAYRKNFSSQHMLIRLIESWKKQLDNSNIVGAVLMDLSKAFDCIPHDLLIAKLHAYGFDISALCFIYSYLKGRMQSVRINNVYSIYLMILSGVPQGSILGPIFFNVFINDFILFLKKCDPFNFADDNTLSAFAKIMKDLVLILENDCDATVDWLEFNQMLANPSKFHAIFLCKDKKQCTINVPIKVKDKIIYSESSVKLLGLTIDDHLKFDKHVDKLCKQSSGQLNQLFRLKRYISFAERKVCVDSFIFANFNYCPLVWHHTTAKSINKIEKIQERALRFLYDDFINSYDKLLEIANRSTMTINRLRCLCIEIFKTLKNMNPSYMTGIFKKRENRHSSRLNNIEVPMVNQVTYGKNSLRALGPKIWNTLPDHIKSSETLIIFKKSIKTWDGENCKCNFCI